MAESHSGLHSCRSNIYVRQAFHAACLFGAVAIIFSQLLQCCGIIIVGHSPGQHAMNAGDQGWKRSCILFGDMAL